MAAVLQLLATMFGYGGGTYAVGGLSDLYGGPSSLRWATMTIALLYIGAAWAFLRVARHVRSDLARVAAMA